VTNLRRLLGLFLKRWPVLVLSLFAMLVVAAGTAALTELVGAMFDVLAAADNQQTPAGGLAATPTGTTGLAKTLGEWRLRAQEAIQDSLPRPGLAIPLLLALTLLVKNLAQVVAQISVNWIGLRTVRDLRQSLYESVLQRSIRFFTDHTTGQLTSHLINDLERIQNSIGRQMGPLVQDTLIVIVLLAYIFTLNPRLAILVFVIAPAVVVPVLKMARRLRTIATSSQQRVAELTETLQESIRGHRIVKGFGGEAMEGRRFWERNTGYYRTLLREAWIQAANNPLMETVAGIGMIGIFVYAQHEIAAGRASLATYTSFVAAMALVYQPIKRLNTANQALQQALAAADRVFGVLDLPQDVADRADAGTLDHFEASIRFDRVGFEYNAGEPVLSDIELELERGQVVALVGPSGGGKSTITHLLLRFYDVTEGRITIDGTDIRDLTQESLRAHIGLVTQEVFLFNDTVRNNIVYGRPDATQAEIDDAVAAAYAGDFIRALPKGFDTMVGEAGVRLSGGQRQRLAIARALLKDAPILILDEATSALDVESERMVQKALDNLMQNRTTLVVAHRLSTIRRANRIVVLEAGRIVEVGTHDQLLKADGVYARLHRLHSFDETTQQ
jgi:subfamily B ATP-binding cassette protein MsbA